MAEIATRPLQDFAACNRVILLSEACAIHKMAKSRPEEYESLLSRLLPGTALTAVDYGKAIRTRARYTQEFNEIFHKFDAIITINNMEPAFPIGTPLCAKNLSRQTRTPFNVTGNPLAVPIGFNSENTLVDAGDNASI